MTPRPPLHVNREALGVQGNPDAWGCFLLLVAFGAAALRAAALGTTTSARTTAPSGAALRAAAFGAAAATSAYSAGGYPLLESLERQV